MTLKYSSELKELFKNIYKDNELHVDYTIAFEGTKGFINFGLFINIDELPTTFEELFKLSNKSFDINNINIFIIIKNSYKQVKDYEHFKIEFVELIL